jgi:hypothetical protein
MTLTPLQRAILVVLGPRGATSATTDVRDALAAGRPSHVVTMARLLDELWMLHERGLVGVHDYPTAKRWNLTDAGLEMVLLDRPPVSPLEADLLLELDKAQEGDETPLVTLRRVIRQAAEARDLRERVTALEAEIRAAAEFIAPPLGSPLPADDLIAARDKADALRAVLLVGGNAAPAEASDAPRLDDLASFSAHVFPGFTGAPTIDNRLEIESYLEGYVYRLRHGATPSVEFNGDTPYAKRLDIEGGQNCRVSWERGWKAAHDAMARAEAGRAA